MTLVRWTIALAAPVVVGCSGMEPSPMAEVPFHRNRLAAGEVDSCVVTDAQQLICWGRTPPTLVPVPEGPILSVSVGTHTCLLANAGTAYCWGFNRYGQLGDGTIQSKATPTPVATELRFAAIAAGAHSTCAITRLGELYCWGANDSGALGTGTAREGQTVLTPMPAKTTRRFDYVGGSGTYCAHATDQKVYCWGGANQ